MKLKKVRTPMGAILAQEPQFASQLKAGDLVEGRVIERTGSTLFVDVPPLGTGIVFGKEYRDAKEIIRNLTPGETVAGKVIEPENDAGYIEISLAQAGRERTWERLQELKTARGNVEVSILGANRGGLIVELEGVQGFLPVSQLNSQHYPRVRDGDKTKIFEELKKFIGTTITVKVIGVNAKEQKLIVSEKEVELENVSQIVRQYQVGDVIEGEVSGVVDFGAFVRFRAPRVAEGGETSALADAEAPGPELEGLIHISELDYKLITNPSDIVKVGERVKAKILAIDHGRISLSLKRLKDDPWVHIERRWSKGDLVEAKVIKIDHYGALVELMPGVHGLCHISEWASPERMREELTVGEAYPFRILELKPEERKLMVGLLRPTPTMSSPEMQGSPTHAELPGQDGPVGETREEIP